MKITAMQSNVTQIAADAVVVGHYADSTLGGPAAEVDAATGGALTRLTESKDITGKHAELTQLLAPNGIRASQVLVVGLGSREKLDRGAAFRATATASKHLAGKKRERVAFYLSDGWTDDLVEAGVCAAAVGCHGQDLYRAEKKRHPFDEILWAGGDDSVLASGQILADSVNLARRLVNEPPSEIYPESFAAAAEDVARECGLEIETWDQDRLELEHCGSLLAVARGSDRPARLVILRHSGGKNGDPTLALVGKGVTFDSGGLSIKPTDGMKTMKCDMAGAATVVGAMQAIARLKLPINVIGLVGLVENMLSGKSYKLGDVLTARSGKTIEVLNTDAEGRLVLADVLDVAIERGAAKIIDLATLTGACVVALGTDVAGLMTNDQSWCDTVAAAARTCGEPAWQLPMFPEYGEQIKSEVADIKNVGEGRWGGAITAAKFLEEFVAGKPWVHMDIAGPSFLESSKPWLDGGGSGAFVRTLIEVARNWKA
jgi:leucyl aminopeptidase